MRNGFEIAGSVLNASGAIWLLIDTLRTRSNLQVEGGASKLRDILKSFGKENVLTDPKTGKALKSDEALRQWFASYTIAWNGAGLLLIILGFVLDLIGKVFFST